MKKIGILGGLAPESTAEYYRMLIQFTKDKGWGRKYPEIIIYSLNFQEFFDPLEKGEFSRVTSLLSEGIQSLHNAGADFALIASNTPHMFFDEVRKASPIPLISIVEETRKESKERGFEKVGLWGTGFTMREDFYKKEFTENNISLVVPDEEAQEYIHNVILDELVQGKIVEETREKLVEIAQQMVKQEKIQALILGCTELPMILNEEVLGLAVLNTTKIHAKAAFSQAVDQA